MELGDNFHGAKFEEIIGLINRVSGDEDSVWTSQGDQRMASNNIAGITLRVRQVFHDKGLTRLSISGNGWMVGFTVTRQRPRNLDDAVPTLVNAVVLADHKSVQKHGGKANLCLHSPTILSPDAFQKEMTLLRMFASDW